MQPTLTTVAESADLFNLGPLIVVNLHCIPTLVCRFAAKMKQGLPVFIVGTV